MQLRQYENSMHASVCRLKAGAQKNLLGNWMSTGLVCVCVAVCASVCVQGCYKGWASSSLIWYPPASPHNCHAKEDATSARPGENLSIFCLCNERLTGIFPGLQGEAGKKINFLIQIKDLEILVLCSIPELVLKLYTHIRKKLIKFSFLVKQHSRKKVIFS